MTMEAVGGIAMTIYYRHCEPSLKSEARQSRDRFADARDDGGLDCHARLQLARNDTPFFLKTKPLRCPPTGGSEGFVASALTIYLG